MVQRGDTHYRYDDNGRLVEKIAPRDGFRPQIWRYRWDTQNQLTQCETPDGSRWQYKYDPFGRRIQKQKTHDGKRVAENLQLWLAGKPDRPENPQALGGYDYLWSGDQLIEEVPFQRDGTRLEARRVRWLYEPGSLTPAARFERGKLHYAISDHQGTVRELLDEQGEMVWGQRLTTWGKAEIRPAPSHHPDHHVQSNFRFLGQYFDEESGLFYNRHRYYSPETAQYISPDPIGLAGGFNPYSYVHNPAKFVDPLGLSGTSGTKPDFYVGPDGPSATMPSTAYRFMSSESQWAAATIESKTAPLSYFGYSKYNTGREARDAYQIFYEKGNPASWSDARLRGEFDTLQLYKNGVPQVKVPLANGDKGPGLELFTSAYPQYGKGGAVQLLPIEKNLPVTFDKVTIIPE